MPYKIVKEKDGYYVVGPGGRKNAKPYKSRAAAMPYLRALYAHEPKGEKK